MPKSLSPYGKIGQGNAKMPGTVYSIDAFACITGSKLATIDGTPCSICYARKLQNFRTNLGVAYRRNLEAWRAVEASKAYAAWSANMAAQITARGTAYHRWFDFGDLQSTAMLRAIADVAIATPTVNHWLPTQERGMLAEFTLLYGPLPANLVVRVSASTIDGAVPKSTHSSIVVTHATADTWPCEARMRGNQCGDCRACWNPSVKTVAYPKH